MLITQFYVSTLSDELRATLAAINEMRAHGLIEEAEWISLGSKVHTADLAINSERPPEGTFTESRLVLEAAKERINALLDFHEVPQYFGIAPGDVVDVEGETLGFWGTIDVFPVEDDL